MVSLCKLRHAHNMYKYNYPARVIVYSLVFPLVCGLLGLTMRESIVMPRISPNTPPLFGLVRGLRVYSSTPTPRGKRFQ